MESGLNVMVWSRSFLNLSIFFLIFSTSAGSGQTAFVTSPDVNRGRKFSSDGLFVSFLFFLVDIARSNPASLLTTLSFWSKHTTTYAFAFYFEWPIHHASQCPPAQPDSGDVFLPLQ